MLDWNQYKLRFKNVKYVTNNLELKGYRQSWNSSQTKRNWTNKKTVNDMTGPLSLETHLPHYSYWTMRYYGSNKLKFRKVD